MITLLVVLSQIELAPICCTDVLAGFSAYTNKSVPEHDNFQS